MVGRTRALASDLSSDVGFVSWLASYSTLLRFILGHSAEIPHFGTWWSPGARPKPSSVDSPTPRRKAAPDFSEGNSRREREDRLIGCWVDFVPFLRDPVMWTGRCQFSSWRPLFSHLSCSVVGFAEPMKLSFSGRGAQGRVQTAGCQPLIRHFPSLLALPDSPEDPWSLLKL